MRSLGPSNDHIPKDELDLARRRARQIAYSTKQENKDRKNLHQREINRRWYAENRYSELARVKKYQLDNPEVVYESRRRYRELNRERRLKYSREWHKANREWLRAYKHMRRVSVSDSQWNLINSTRGVR